MEAPCESCTSYLVVDDQRRLALLFVHNGP